MEGRARRGVADERVIDDEKVVRRRELDQGILAEAGQGPRRPLDTDVGRHVPVDIVRSEQWIESAWVVPGDPAQGDGFGYQGLVPPQSVWWT
jgi:hypothetical protein